MFSIRFFIPLTVLTFGLLFGSCKKDEKDPDPLPAQTASLMVSANPAPVGPFSYFSFEQGAAVSPSMQNTEDWDFGLRFTTFVVNSGISGPGMGGVIVQDGLFDEITEAPEAGYKTDAEGDLAVTDGEWYNYNPVTREFSPKAGKVFLFRTGKGKYAKMELTSVDPTDNDGNVVTPPTQPTMFRYNMRYVFQQNGSRRF